MAYHFEEDEACEFGDREAILIYNFRFWIRKNKANGKHFYDGRTWTYNKLEAFPKLFRFWTRPRIRGLIDSLVEQKVLLKGNYNNNPHDRTCWYAFVDEVKFLREVIIDPPPPLEPEDLSFLANANAENNKSICENNQIEMLNSSNPIVETIKCIEVTNIKPFDKPNIKPYSKMPSKTDESELFFNILWEGWTPTSDDKGNDCGWGSKKLARIQWDKLMKKGENPNHIIWGAAAYLKKKQKSQTQSAHVRTFLSQEIWEEFIEAELKKHAAEQELTEKQAEAQKSFEDKSSDPFWIKAKQELLDAPEIPSNFKSYIENFQYRGIAPDLCHIIDTPSKFVRDWMQRQYQTLFNKIFGAKKWVLICSQSQ